MKSCFRLTMACLTLLMMAAVCTAYGQDYGTTSGPPTDPVSINKMTFRTTKFVCGGKAQAGTPIAGNDTTFVNHTSGTITISGIPPTASVVRADLFWTVLTNSATSSPTGAIISFNGNPVSGSKIGTEVTSPCFPQANTIAYLADVTSLVANPGNGSYAVSGFPGGPSISSDFTEGATLQVLWSDPNGLLREDNLYHASGATPGTLAVTLGEFFSQNMAIFGTNSSGPVSATLYEVIGNGQSNAPENLRFNGPCGQLNLDNTLDGSTVAHAPNTCASTIGTQCFWDDDVVNVSAQFACPAGNGATLATLVSNPAQTPTFDCIDWDALNLLTSTDPAHVCAFCGNFVDAACPPNVPYRNHGQYVSCVAHAAEECLSGLPVGGSCPREDIQSCVVNPRARSGVGK